uniref:Ig-like domain-containing protein n=1 Tax=Nothobranchius furzeri TaxID=105023 RepID=A0A8C6L9I1_NOTFU
MGSLHLLLIFCKICKYLIHCLSFFVEIIQDSGIKMAKIGENVTLHCTCRDTSVTSFAWYLQSLGTKPHLISSRMKHSPKAEITPLYQKRFEVFAHSQNGISDLKISYLQLSDPGTYYCGTLTFNAIQFGQGVFLQVKTSLSNRRSVIYQPVNRTLRLGQTMNLSCTVYTEPFAGNTSLFWFRDGSSHPDVMYPSEGNRTNLSDNPRHGKSSARSAASTKSVRPHDC